MLPRLVTSRAASGNHAGPIGTDGSAALRKESMIRRSKANVFPLTTSWAMRPKAKTSPAIVKTNGIVLVRWIVGRCCDIEAHQCWRE